MKEMLTMGMDIQPWESGPECPYDFMITICLFVPRVRLSTSALKFFVISSIGLKDLQTPWFRIHSLSERKGSLCEKAASEFDEFVAGWASGAGWDIPEPLGREVKMSS